MNNKKLNELVFILGTVIGKLEQSKDPEKSEVINLLKKSVNLCFESLDEKKLTLICPSCLSDLEDMGNRSYRCKQNHYAYPTQKENSE